MQKAHLLAAGAGWQLETHAIGDRAIDEVLDSYAAVIQQLGLNDPRFRIVHAGISTPAMQKRLHELNVLVDGNPPFVYWIGSWFHKYGPERVRWSYPANLTSKTESSRPPAPMCRSLQSAHGGGSGPQWFVEKLRVDQIVAPEERISVKQALTLYTRNGAYAGFEENSKGTLEPGKLADFIIIDRDVLSVPTDQIKNVKVLQTFVGGRKIYDDLPIENVQ